MRSINLKGAVGKFLLAFSLFFGIGITSGLTAQAQWQTDPYRNDRDYQREREREQRRREREYRREQERRNRDYNNDDYYNRNRDYDYQNDQWGRNRDNGRWGRRGRSGDGYGNYGGSYDLRQTALNAGFADGVKAGRKDRQRNRRYDYSDESEYQKGTRDYNSRLGDRYIYQRYYREAFEHGYADGYAGY